MINSELKTLLKTEHNITVNAAKINKAVKELELGADVKELDEVGIDRVVQYLIEITPKDLNISATSIVPSEKGAVKGAIPIKITAKPAPSVSNIQEILSNGETIAQSQEQTELSLTSQFDLAEYQEAQALAREAPNRRAAIYYKAITDIKEELSDRWREADVAVMQLVYRRNFE